MRFGLFPLKLATQNEQFFKDLANLIVVNMAMKDQVDIFDLVNSKKGKRNQISLLETELFKKDLTSELAFDILLNFLDGKYFGTYLEQIQRYFAENIKKLYINSPQTKFLQGILSLLSIKNLAEQYQQAFEAIDQIYSLAYEFQTTDHSLTIRLMQNQQFCYLVRKTIGFYWKSKDEFFLPKPSIFSNISSWSEVILGGTTSCTS